MSRRRVTGAGAIWLATATVVGLAFFQTCTVSAQEHPLHSDFRGLTVEPEVPRPRVERPRHDESLEKVIWTTFSEPNMRAERWAFRDPYDCAVWTLRPDGSAATDIEHIVAWEEALDSGLQPGQYHAFINYPFNLTLAAPHTNRAEKSDKDFAEWQPRFNRAWMARTVIEVKSHFGLSIDPAEEAALAKVIAKEPPSVHNVLPSCPTRNPR